MALLHLRTAVKYEPINDVSEDPEMQTPPRKVLKFQNKNIILWLHTEYPLLTLCL